MVAEKASDGSAPWLRTGNDTGFGLASDFPASLIRTRKK